MSGDDLPVILVSAVDTDAALAIITELMNDGSSPAQCNGVSHSQGEEEEPEPEPAPVWRLTNKYYSAAVRLRALPDGRAPPPRDHVHAHLIYLTEDECWDCAAVARRVSAAGSARGAVRLVAARAALEPPALVAWARAARYELVALLAPRDPDEDERFPEARGVARLREALHAHVWPNMRRVGQAAVAPLPASDSSAESSDEEWGAWRGADDADDEAGAVRRAEQFADALALLPARRDDASDADDATRRLHAEQLVAAFCRALGHDLDLDGGGGGGGGAQ